MTAARDAGRGAADPAGLKAALCTGRGAGRVVFCRVGKDGELIQKLHFNFNARGRGESDYAAGRDR